MKLDNTFNIRDVINYKKSTQIRLYTKSSFNCVSCSRKHEKDNCAFIDITYNAKTKKTETTLKCYKSLGKK